MAVRISKFAGEFAALAAWTGDSEEQLRAEADYHAEDRDHWLAWDGDLVVGAVHPWRGPDGRLRLYFGKWRADAFVPLAGVIDAECYAMADAGDTALLGALSAAGFAEYRRENDYEIPVARVESAVPAGIRVITADATELVPLMLLDCAIRADTPGADGWQPDPVWFREETYDSPFFDPPAYRVALDGDRYVGLARIWKQLPGRRYRRLGCVGVLAPYRRRGLGRALLAQALAPLAEAGETTVTAEADASDPAATALLRGLGARVTGATVELHRPGSLLGICSRFRS
jgi:ribosomal protein S18 acetylase RimI-like enzyme